MKFARYLEETQTPEWKKAYIDYRGLKKRITAIRRSHHAASRSSSDEDLLAPQASPLGRTNSNDPHASGASCPSADLASSIYLSPPSEDTHPSDDERTHERPATLGVLDKPGEPQSGPAKLEHRDRGKSPTRPTLAARSMSVHTATALPRSRQGRINIITTALNRALHRTNSTKGTGSGLSVDTRFDVRRPIPLMDLLPQLTAAERAFFDKLDQELDKVESFYCERERDMRHRANLLKEQLQELKDHRRAFYDAHPAAGPYAWLPLPFPSPIIPSLLIHRRIAQHGGQTLHTHHHPSPSPKNTQSWKRSSSRRHPEEISRSMDGKDDVVELTMPKVKQSDSTNADGTEGAMFDSNTNETPATSGRPSQRWSNGSMSKSVQALFTSRPAPPIEERGSDSDANGQGSRDQSGAADAIGSDMDGTVPSSPRKGANGLKYDPEEYLHAKKQLKKAVLECYRGLELLDNYRTLNLIGFRKALKKFEKVTHIPAQLAYTKEKIEPSTFSSGATVDALRHDMEALFAARFARGDMKKAMARLRGGAKHTSHHFSTFRTGMALGLAIPALVSGLYQSYQVDTRAAIPGWDGLMFIYGILIVPTLLSLLVGANLLVWARARINYVFIFELDLRTTMDHRVYFEIPAYLLSLLCHAFWLSFSRIGTEHVAPTTWPLLWLAFAALVVFDPLPVMFKASRWWLIRNVSKLLTSGMHRVEFADFWMGDQFSSLVFTLSNLYFIGCAYATGIDASWRQCTPHPGPRWGVAFLLASLPLLVRLVQSVKRYADSGLITHLINGGKYGSGIIYYLFYYIWRQQGGNGPLFVAWCISAINYSLYAGAWDLLMDWSLLRPHAPYPLLRNNLLYTNHIPFYYFAIVSNTLIRFIWVFYIPDKGPDSIVRTFIAGFLEVLRRWQWNFLRLENEHLGNIDQYRVTREVPLPYSYDDHLHDSDGDDDEDARTPRTAASRSWRVNGKAPESDRTAAEIGAVDD